VVAFTSSVVNQVKCLD